MIAVIKMCIGGDGKSEGRRGEYGPGELGMDSEEVTVVGKKPKVQ